ncbi:single-stranded-DNA-specific exonuclease RecJ [Simiduia agarivorans]|uniref:Single-stranded-DNA-specific exonuclease RecJ n=1 Tax=Simiduia agarivorans (strain DSM 21679 / JCM 13881 / BCRC 17597 / SA1) TaxID=1117647 RepID=K4KG12_SIMAS|nr:single-stranded-DNA-specific exonuclease RecJ [Simiduia agarivorans]AFU97896.1 single-stranded-DNA-specific exonuclease RecJ [Simiduia agarivorans SA1 = DSM 21679]
MKIQTRHYTPDDCQFSPAMPAVLQRVYAARGIRSEQQLPDKLSELLPPNMKGMDAAVALLTQAVTDQRKVLILGDFDADGATSSALAVLALKAMGLQTVDYLVPNRFDYGYGLTPEIAAVAKTFDPWLIVTVDNGISSIEGASAVKAAGIRLLITDHHLPADESPDADAIVNPNQRGCEFPSKNLAGVGVIFYVLSCLRTALQKADWFSRMGISAPAMGEFLDIVALGTVADVVPLDANNRLLVAQGLARIRAGRCRPGIIALLQVAGRNYQRVAAQDMGFFVGPRLNAAGRLDDMSLGIRCLLAPDYEEALGLAQQLDDFNRDRRQIEAGMQKEAEAFLARMQDDDHNPWGVSLFHEQWHQGVIGILASRVKDKLHRPVITFADAGDGLIKGSGRSIQGLHLRDALDRVSVKNPGLIKKFGGHAMAAGLTIARAEFERFANAFDQVCRQLLTEADLQAVIFTDGELLPTELNLDTAFLLADAGPFGQQFPEPQFEGEFILRQARIVGNKHLKMTVSPAQTPTLQLDAIAFNVDVAVWPDASVERVRLVYKLDVNEFRGQQSAQLLVTYLCAS